jgi:hypothetical protein
LAYPFDGDLVVEGEAENIMAKKLALEWQEEFTDLILSSTG